MDESLSQPALRFALVSAALGAVVILSGIFPELLEYGALGVIVLATLATGAERRRQGGGWWLVLGIGAALSLVGAGVAELEDTIGGLLGVIGGALVVIGAVIGFPADSDA